MSKRSFLPPTDGEKNDWLENFAAKLPGYDTKYAIPTADVTDTANGSAYFDYWFKYLNQYRGYISKLVAFKNELATGTVTSVEPGPPVLPAAPTAVASGIITRAVSIAQRIKNHNNYTVADGMDMGIEGDEVTVEDPNTLKPAITVRLVDGGHPEIVWKKKSADALRIEVDRGSGFVFLVTDTIPNYTDMAALPTGAAVWKYRCVYLIDDSQVGQWSDIVSTTVTATP